MRSVKHLRKLNNNKYYGLKGLKGLSTKSQKSVDNKTSAEEKCREVMNKFRLCPCFVRRLEKHGTC